MTDAAALFTAKSPPSLFQAQAPSPFAASGQPLGQTEGNGAISGGELRPGSIDQATFVQMLLQQQQQQQQNRQAAGVGGKAVPMPIQSFQSAPKVPTLSSAQFAALVGQRNANSGLAAAADPQAMDPQAMDPRAVAAAQQAQARAAPMGPALKLSGSSNRNASAPAQTGNLPLTGNAAGSGGGDDKPTITRKAQPQQMAALATSAAPSDDVPTITRKSAPSAEAVDDARAEDKPAAREEEAASKGDPNVVHLKSPPDKDQQKELRMRNKRWVVDETPGARQLFFGADGTFGWDDFVDMINPLQHIPGIAQIYRAVTGDEINGAANLLGAIPFGPFGGLGLIASVADLAVKDTTGKDMGGNLMAMVFGKDEAPAEGGKAVPADMAEAPVDGKVTIQSAAIDDHYAISSASEMHAACRG